MEFNGKEGAPISLLKAKKWTKNYREHELTYFPDQMIINAHFFGREIIERILLEPGCMGIRIYYAINDEGKKHLILVGAKRDIDNILPKGDPSVAVTLDGGDDVIANDSLGCPPNCPQNEL